MKITSDNAFFEIRKQIQKIEKYSFQYSYNLKKTYGITGPQIGLLKAIARTHSKPPSMTELAKAVGAHITTVEGMVNRLSKGKLVKKQKNKNDKRIVELTITKEGREIIKKAPLGAMGQLYYNLKKIPETEARQIYKAMARLAVLCGAEDVEFD
jgi:MarR family transcriptional regulator, organic hydroperoxide resistance regulator